MTKCIAAAVIFFLVQLQPGGLANAVPLELGEAANAEGARRDSHFNAQFTDAGTDLHARPEKRASHTADAPLPTNTQPGGVSLPTTPAWSFPTDYSIPSYTFPTWVAPSITVPTDAYSFPMPTYPDYSFSYPTYSFSMPSYSIPTYDPVPMYNAGGSGGYKPGDSFGGGGGEFANIAKKAKLTMKQIIGIVVGSVTGFIGFLGGLWAACKRKMRRKKRGGHGSEGEKYPVHGGDGGLGNVPTMPYRPGPAPTGPFEQEPLLHGGNYPPMYPPPQHNRGYAPTAF